MEADRMFNNHSSILKLKITSTDRLGLQLSELYENEINQILVFDYRDSSNYDKTTNKRVSDVNMKTY